MNELLTYAMQNNLDAIKMYKDIAIKDERGRGILHYAVLGQAFDVVQYLIDQNYNLNEQDDAGETALFDCARKGKLNMAKLLLKHYAKVNIENKRRELVIHHAAKKGDLMMIKLLIEHETKLDFETQTEQLPIHYAILGGQLEALKYLMEISRTSYLHKDSYGNTLLHYAAKTTNQDMLAYMLERELNVNELNDQFETALFYAVTMGSYDTVHMLLEHGAYIEIKNRRYETVIDLATIYDKQSIKAQLLSYQGLPKYEKLVKEQALSIAVLNRDHQLLRELVLKNVGLKKDTYHLDALDYAKKYNLYPCIQILREKKA